LYDKISNKQLYGREINDLRVGPVKEPRAPLMGRTGHGEYIDLFNCDPIWTLGGSSFGIISFSLKPKLYLGGVPMGFYAENFTVIREKAKCE